jgi:ABC-2 type transport system ATP-binding protein
VEPLLPALGALPGVRGVAIRHGRLVLSVSEIGAALPAVVALLAREERPLEALTTHQATLEDVFVHLTGRGLRDDAGPAR